MEKIPCIYCTFTLLDYIKPYLEKQGYKIKIEVSYNSDYPSYCFGSVRFYRYVRIILN